LLVHGFRASVEAMLLRAVTAKCKSRVPDFDPFLLPQPEGVVWRLVSEQPAHLLPRPHKSWNELFLSVVDGQLAGLTPDDPDLTKSTWGRANRPQIAHPLAPGLGWFSGWLSAPSAPLPGSPRDMPRVQAPAWGASERFAVSPGREEQGYFQMPGGQSGHPLSPWFLDGYDAWAKGEKTPLLPGETKHTIILKPMSK
jgi:penicillin amidase